LLLLLIQQFSKQMLNYEFEVMLRTFALRNQLFYDERGLKKIEPQSKVFLHNSHFVHEFENAPSEDNLFFQCGLYWKISDPHMINL